MGTYRKLWLGFGTLTALMVLLGLTVIARIQSIESSVGELSDTVRLRSIAAEELEFNAIAYELSVHEYLLGGEPGSRHAAREHAASIRQRKSDYDRWVRTDHERELSDRFAAAWADLEAMGEALLTSDHNPSTPRLANFDRAGRELESLLDEEMQPDAADALRIANESTLRDLETSRTAVLLLLLAGVVVALITSTRVSKGVLGAEKDLAEANKKLAASFELLQGADRRKDEFLATLAHELRNPLAPLRNALHILRKARDRGAQESALACMDRQLGQMVRLVDDLLDVSRITGGKLELRRERVLLSEVVHSAVESSRPLIDARGHALTVTLPKEPVYLLADPTRLAQVLLNLLNNSAKYTDRAGSITLTAEVLAGKVVIRVRDTGIGIPADVLPHVFDMFTQADRTIERTTGGLGIGLTLARRLVELHGGTIAARSDGPGRGSELIVSLPVLEAHRPFPMAKPGEEAPPGEAHRRRILVVDDVADIAESLAAVLEMMGHEVRTAGDGLAALRVGEDFHPDIVLLDIGMPQMSGHEVCRRIKDQPWGKTAVLVAQTGWGSEADRAATREAGFDLHMVKPVDPDTLMRRIEAIYSR